MVMVDEDQPHITHVRSCVTVGLYKAPGEHKCQNSDSSINVVFIGFLPTCYKYERENVCMYNSS